MFGNLQNTCITKVCFVIVTLIFEMVQFCLAGSKVEVDFLAVLSGFAFPPVVAFPLNFFVSGGKIKVKM